MKGNNGKGIPQKIGYPFNTQFIPFQHSKVKIKELVVCTLCLQSGMHMSLSFSTIAYNLQHSF